MCQQPGTKGKGCLAAKTCIGCKSTGYSVDLLICFARLFNKIVQDALERVLDCLLGKLSRLEPVLLPKVSQLLCKPPCPYPPRFE